MIQLFADARAALTILLKIVKVAASRAIIVIVGWHSRRMRFEPLVVGKSSDAKVTKTRKWFVSLFPTLFHSGGLRECLLFWDPALYSLAAFISNLKKKLFYYLNSSNLNTALRTCQIICPVPIEYLSMNNQSATFCKEIQIEAQV